MKLKKGFDSHVGCNHRPLGWPEQFDVQLTNYILRDFFFLFGCAVSVSSSERSGKISFLSSFC
jgi:hypothetical protein